MTMNEHASDAANMKEQTPDAANWPADIREELGLFFAELGPDPPPARIREASRSLSRAAQLYLSGRGLGGAPEDAGDDAPPAG